MASRRRSQRVLSFPEDGKTDTEPCGLCCEHHTQMATPEKWKSDQARTFAVSWGVSLTSRICGACRKDVTRCIGSEDYTPRWTKGTKVNCCALASLTLHFIRQVNQY